jgi:hypothetical protein
MPEIEVRLEQEAYRPCELLAGAFAVEVGPNDQLVNLELSVLWHTTGKGDEDMGVHYFEDWSPERGKPLDLSRPHGFEVQLPRTPLSYDGFLIKVHWCVRVRARWARGKPSMREVSFQLGGVARPG